MVDAGAAAVLVPVNVGLFAAAFRLRTGRRDTFEKWEGPLALARAAADDRALTALEELGVAVNTRRRSGELAPLSDPRDFRPLARTFLKELALRERLPLTFVWLLRAWTVLSLSALAAAVTAVPASIVFLTAAQGRYRVFVFILAGVAGGVFLLAYLMVTLLETRLSAASGRAEA